jgi:branched-subunit amino acid ABC-type transport system permease component
MIVPYQRLVVVAVSLATIVTLWFLLMHTHLGRSIRAVAQNPIGSSLQGISIQRVSAVTMFFGVGLAALSGVLIGSITSVSPFMGNDAIWRAFIIIVVGGIGSIPGVVIASFVFGILDTSLAAAGLGQFVALTDALVMLLILAVRPNGLLGAKE